MKRTERHHLKQNELAHMAGSVRATFEEKGSQLKLIAIAVGAVLVIGGGYAFWSGRTQDHAGSMLAEAMAVQDARVGAPEAPGSQAAGSTFPNEREKLQAMLAKFKAVADQFPDSDEGIFARYREGAVHMALGNAKDAAASYQQVMVKGGESLYGQMARLGLAEAQARSGDVDKAIETYKDLSTRKDGPLPVDGLLMQLGRLYRTAGKSADAEQAFNRLVNEFPDSQFMTDAKRELDEIKKG